MHNNVTNSVSPVEHNNSKNLGHNYPRPTRANYMIEHNIIHVFMCRHRIGCYGDVVQVLLVTYCVYCLLH